MKGAYKRATISPHRIRQCSEPPSPNRDTLLVFEDSQAGLDERNEII